MKKFLALTLAFVLVLATFTACGGNGGEAGANGEKSGNAAANSDKIVLGVINDLTGNRSIVGNALTNGVKLAAEQINANGGVLGKQIELVIYDNKNDGQESINAYTRLADVDKASAVLTTDSSGIFMSLIEISTEKGVPVCGSPSDPRAVMDTEGTGEAYPYTYLVGQPNAPQQAAVIAKYLAENTDLKKAALFYDQSNAFAVAFMNSFNEVWPTMGGEITITETCNSTDQDFSTQLSKFKASGAEFICTPNPTAQLVIMTQQAAQLGLGLPYAGCQDMSDPFLSLLEDPTIVGKSYFHASAYMEDPRLEQFCKDYEAAFGEPATIKAVNGYDMMSVVAKAIEAAGSADREAINKALQNDIVDVQLLCNDHYTQDGKTHSPDGLGLAIYEITNGVLEYKTYQNG